MQESPNIFIIQILGIEQKTFTDVLKSSNTYSFTLIIIKISDKSLTIYVNRANINLY